MFVSIRRDAPRAAKLRYCLLTFALVFGTAQGVSAAEMIPVVVDEAKVVKMPEKVSTLVIGNPMIADVTLQPGGVMVVTGKGYGSTNLIAMDRGGTVLSEREIQVRGGGDKIVTVFRGTERESYSCTPLCQRRITLGDTTAYFKANIDQSDTLNSQAAGVSAAGAANAPR